MGPELLPEPSTKADPLLDGAPLLPAPLDPPDDEEVALIPAPEPEQAAPSNVVPSAIVNQTSRLFMESPPRMRHPYCTRVRVR